ncbi:MULTISPECIES: inclusion body family protein [Chromobacterium]|uniref:inclusion body family protein n=1 Tax=Chromobacterium TaxID=535 RepID=UPI001D092A37|nr:MULTISPECIES: inclusion body family protein [Chromobacterium]MCP1290290.1 inclusion body family protein [Chromobacterium sp. S0633]UJB30803.1 hypothetical protein HQN78_06890 [Chromobacterium sp. Beijing]
MSNIVNIEMVFDTQTILNKYPGPSQNSGQPTGIAHKDVYMVAESRFVTGGQASADLAVKAEVDDVIRWRALSLSSNVSQSVIVYKIQKFSGSQVTSIPVPTESRPWVPIPNQNADKVVDPLNYTAQQIPNYYLGCNVTDTGTENYQVWFYITEQVSGNQVKTLGYFYWDPVIQVS